MKYLVSLVFAFISTLTFAQNQDPSNKVVHPSSNNGVVNIKSKHGVGETIDRLAIILRAKKIKVFKRINHAEAAKIIRKNLRPTELLIFGNPKLGTPLMQCQQLIALDLPQKVLAWQNESGEVWLSYNDPTYLAQRHNIQGCKKVLNKMGKALQALTQKAAN